MGFVANAQKAIECGDIGLAVKIYRAAISAQPELAWVYKGNIARIRSKNAGAAPLVVVNLCSIPSRISSLKATLESLAPQVDQINLYLDGYSEVPSFVRRIAEINHVVLSSECPDLRDNGKFLWVEQYREAYYFTADDDIIYPRNYVESLIEAIELCGRLAVVGVHGFILPIYPVKYFSSDRITLDFWRPLSASLSVNGLGTGTMAFFGATLSGLSLSFFEKPGMTDVYMALFCRERNIPMVAVARPSVWLRELACDAGSLFQEFRHKDEEQSALIARATPWGQPAIERAITAVQEQVHNERVRFELSAYAERSACYIGSR